MPHSSQHCKVGTFIIPILRSQSNGAALCVRPSQGNLIGDEEKFFIEEPKLIKCRRKDRIGGRESLLCNA